MGIGTISSSLSRMRSSITHSVDNAGNNLMVITPQSLIGKLAEGSFFDMTTQEGKAKAVDICSPLSMALNRIGMLLTNGQYYIMDSDKNNILTPEATQIQGLLDNPNPTQSGGQFLKDIALNLKLYGYCPIYTLRATKTSIPDCMYVINPIFFKAKATGKMFNQRRLSDIIEKAYIQIGTEIQELKEHEYFILTDSGVQVDFVSNELVFRAPTDSLTYPVSNWVAQMKASNTLIVDGGAKGIICSDDTTEYGNAALTSGEQKELNLKFQKTYGLVDKAFSIAVTKARLRWIPMNFDSSQLRLEEEDVRCTAKIANALGFNPDTFATNSTYSNQEAADRKAYQDVIIPDAKLICNTFTRNLCSPGMYISLDFSHVTALQKSRSDEAKTMQTLSQGIKILIESGVMTPEEARIEIAKFTEIDPNTPNGNLVNTVKKE